MVKYKYEILWEKDYEDGYAGCRVAIDSKNNIIVCGVDKENRGLVIKYDKDGNIIWSDHTLPKIFAKQFLFLPVTPENLFSGMGSMLDVAVDSKDNIVVVGSFYDESGKSCISYVKKYSPDGKKLWDRVISPFLYTQILGIHIDFNDKIFLAGYGGKLMPPALHGFVFKLNSNGMVILRKIIRKIGYTGYTSIISNNDFVASGFLSRKNEFYFMLTKFGRFGIKKRELLLDRVAIPAKIIMENENFISVGQIQKESGYNHYIIKTDNSFSVLWENVGMNGALYDVALSEYGIIVTGKNGDEYYAGLYGDNGEKLMDIFLGKLISNGNDINDWMRGVAVDSEGNIIVTGAAPVVKTIKFRIIEPEEHAEIVQKEQKRKKEREKGIIEMIIDFLRRLFG